MFLIRSDGTPVAFIIKERNKVKKVKLKIKPKTIPSGFFLSDVMEELKIIGRIGRIQGERIVTIPAKKAKSRRKIINISQNN